MAGAAAAAVSVILIVRNGAADIAQALASVYQSQLHPNELLLRALRRSLGRKRGEDDGHE